MKISDYSTKLYHIRLSMTLSVPEVNQTLLVPEVNQRHPFFLAECLQQQLKAIFNLVYSQFCTRHETRLLQYNMNSLYQIFFLRSIPCLQQRDLCNFFVFVYVKGAEKIRHISVNNIINVQTVLTTIYCILMYNV